MCGEICGVTGGGASGIDKDGSDCRLRMDLGRWRGATWFQRPRTVIKPSLDRGVNSLMEDVSVGIVECRGGECTAGIWKSAKGQQVRAGFFVSAGKEGRDTLRSGAGRRKKIVYWNNGCNLLKSSGVRFINCGESIFGGRWKRSIV